MKLVYKPVGIVLGVIGGILAKRVFRVMWRRVDDAEPPKATTRETTLARVIGAAAIQGATFKVVRALVDRGGARGWERLTGFWPGERRPKSK